MSKDNPHDYYVDAMHLKRGGNDSQQSIVTVSIPKPGYSASQDVNVTVNFSKELTTQIVEAVEKAWEDLV